MYTHIQAHRHTRTESEREREREERETDGETETESTAHMSRCLIRQLGKVSEEGKKSITPLFLTTELTVFTLRTKEREQKVWSLDRSLPTLPGPGCQTD